MHKRQRAIRFGASWCGEVHYAAAFLENDFLFSSKNVHVEVSGGLTSQQKWDTLPKQPLQYDLCDILWCGSALSIKSHNSIPCLHTWTFTSLPSLVSLSIPLLFSFSSFYSFPYFCLTLLLFPSLFSSTPYWSDTIGSHPW